MKELSKRNDIKFNFDDIINLCEFMIRDQLYIEAYCYILAIVNSYVQMFNGNERKNNFQPAHKISKMLGMLISLFAKVTFVNKYCYKYF